MLGRGEAGGLPITITISKALLTLPDRIDAAYSASLDKSSAAIAEQIRAQYEEDNAIASRATYNSVRELEARRDFRRIGADTLQAQFVERGRRPGKVPAWIEFKPILRKWADDKGLGFSDSALYLIARKIRRQGFAGRYSVKVSAEKVSPEVWRIFQAEFRRI